MTDYNASGGSGSGPPPDAGLMLTPLRASGPGVRTLLARKLTDIAVLPPGRISSNERALVADLLLHILDKVEQDIRIEVAQRLARAAECPPALLRMLLLDEAAVAEHVAAGAEYAPEALLIEAAREGGTAHRLAIAKRPDLSTAVADACLSFDEMDVCKRVLKRETCPLSPNAVNRLVALSARNKDVQSLLLRRPELEPAHGFIMFWWVDAERRRRILTRFALDRGVIQDALADLYPKVFRGGDPDPVVKDILVLSDRRHRPRGVNGEPVSMDVVARTLGAACKYPAPELIDAVAMIGGVSRELASRIVSDPGGEPFAVLCKSLGVARDVFYGFLTDAAASEETTARADRLLAVFDTMARDFSRAVLRYWDWDTNPRIAGIARLMSVMEDGVAPVDLDPLADLA